MLINDLIFFFIGLFGLWLGSELIVKGALRIARSLGLSETFIGLTILAIGTDFPEIIISFTAALEKVKGQETSGIVVGNILGSAMCQIAFVLGIAGLLRVLKINQKKILNNGLILILVTIVLLFFSSDGLISQVEGLIFVLIYIAYFLSLNRQTKLDRLKHSFSLKKTNHSFFPLLILIIGLVIISECSQLVISRGISLASDFGLSQLIIGIILVGVGTSLPELVVSINATIKGSTGLSVGNLIGSNLVDISLALGGSAMISTWNVDRQVVMFDLPFLLLTSVIVILFLLTRQKLERKESVLILSLYSIYIILKLSGW